MRTTRGATALETALVLPIVFAFVFGAADWAWLFFQWMTVRSAALEGARLAGSVVSEAELQAIASPAVLAHAGAFLLDSDAVGVTADAEEHPYGRTVTVTVTYAYEPLFGLGVRPRALAARATAPWYGWIYEEP